MKKTIAVLLAGSLIACSFPVLAEDFDKIDFSSYSAEELLELRKEVDDALYEKDGKVVIQNGTYIAGKDIAPGTYVVSIYSLDVDDSGGTYVSVQKYEGAGEEYGSKWDQYYAEYCAVEEKINNGEEADWPEEPKKSDYYVLNRDVVYANDSVRFTLEDGQVLILDDWTGEVVNTIEQAEAGLFMD